MPTRFCPLALLCSRYSCKLFGMGRGIFAFPAGYRACIFLKYMLVAIQDALVGDTCTKYVFFSLHDWQNVWLSRFPQLILHAYSCCTFDWRYLRSIVLKYTIAKNFERTRWLNACYHPEGKPYVPHICPEIHVCMLAKELQFEGPSPEIHDSVLV